MLTVHNVFRYLPGGSGAFRPEVLPGKEDRNAPFQDAAIDTGVGQVGQVLEFNQLQAEGDDHNIEMTQYMMPPLTTYAAPIDELAQCSIATLIAQMDEPDKTIRKTLPGMLVERGSVKTITV